MAREPEPPGREGAGNGGRNGDRGAPGVPGEAEAYRLLEGAVDGILARNEHARRAHDAMVEAGRTQEEAKEQIARVLIAVMYHVGDESKRLQRAGGGEALRREAFERLARGETADDIFGEREG